MIHLILFLFLGLLPPMQQIVPEKILTIGTREGSGPAVFGRVKDVELDETGTVYILDNMNMDVRVFSLDGAHRRTFGRKGDGPREFRSPRALDRVDGNIVVTEAGKMSRFSPDGEFLGSQRVPVIGVVRALPLLQEEDVLVLREGTASVARIDGNQVVMILQRGEWSDILKGAASTVFYRDSGQAWAMKSPLCSSLYLAPLHGGGFLVAHGGEGLVRRFDTEGVAVASMRVTGEAAPVSSDRERELLGVARKVAPRATRQQVVMPPYESTICGLEVESHLRAWVQLAPDGSGQVWQALDLETGSLSTSLVLPLGVKVVAFRNGRVAAILQDEWGVDYVYLYAIPEAGK